jgi:hypothetical protein
VGPPRFEFRFVACHPLGQSLTNAASAALAHTAIEREDAAILQAAGAEGWEIVGMSINPRYTDQLLIALQREVRA